MSQRKGAISISPSVREREMKGSVRVVCRCQMARCPSCVHAKSSRNAPLTRARALMRTFGLEAGDGSDYINSTPPPFDSI